MNGFPGSRSICNIPERYVPALIQLHLQRITTLLPSHLFGFPCRRTIRRCPGCAR